MRKLLLKILLLISISAFVTWHSDRLFSTNNFFKRTVSELNQEHDFNVLILGSSRAHSNFDPRIFESQLGEKTINLGAPAQKFETTEAVLSHALKKVNPKLIIIDVYMLSIGPYYTDKGKTDQLQSFNQLPASFYKYDQLNKVFGKNRGYRFVSTTLLNHNQWNKVLDGSLNNSSLFNGIDYYQGFRSFFREFSEDKWDKFTEEMLGKSKDDKPVVLPKESLDKIDNFLELLKNCDCDYIFVNSPSYYMDYDKRIRLLSEKIENYLRDKNLPYFDFNTVKDSLGLNKSSYSDANHLNVQGAILASQHLSKLVGQKFNLKKGNLNDELIRTNRYEQITNGFKNSLFSTTNNANEPSMYSNLQEVHLLSSGRERLELIIKIANSEEFDLTVQIKGGLKPIRKTLTKANVISYKGSQYAVYPFNQTINKRLELEIILGANDPLRYEVNAEEKPLTNQ